MLGRRKRTGSFYKLTKVKIPQFFSICIAVCLQTAMLVSCEKKSSAAQELFARRERLLPNATIKNFQAYYTLKGNIALILEAPLMQDYTGNWDFPFQIFPESVYITILQAGSEHSKTFITADSAVVYKQTELTELMGHVNISNEKDESLRTSQLFWDKKHNHIFTDKSVIFKRANEYIKGRGFDSNMHFTNARVNNVEGIVHVKK